MKQKLLTLAAAFVVATFTSTARADLYSDTVGDEFTGNGILDIVSVEVTNNFADLIFKINVNGDPVATDWGKYCIGFTTGSGGDTTANGNGWGRAVSMTQGMNYWIGSWVDGTMGAQLWSYDGAFWNGPTGASVSKDTSSVTIHVPFAGLGKAIGDSVDFDVYTTGGGGTDPAIDSLADPSQTVSDWAGTYAGSKVVSYKIQTVPATTNHVTFLCDMEVPIYEYDHSLANGFLTNSDILYVRGSFNGWGAARADQMFQVGPTLFSNTVEVVSALGDPIQYKFEGVSFPGYENPVLTAGGNRALVITNENQTAPFAFFDDRALSNGVSTVTLSVDMSLALNFGVFDPATNGLTLPGSFNGWNTTIQPMTAGAPPDTNIYSSTLTFNYYPLGSQNIGFYKCYITNLVNAGRDNGWENPISNGGGNRAFAITSSAQTNTFYYNDENPNFNVLSVQKLNADSAKINWLAFPARGTKVPTGGVYNVESRTSLTSGSWTTNGTVIWTNNSSTGTFTNNGLTGVPAQYYRVSLIGLQ